MRRSLSWICRGRRAKGEATTGAAQAKRAPLPLSAAAHFRFILHEISTEANKNKHNPPSTMFYLPTQAHEPDSVHMREPRRCVHGMAGSATSFCRIYPRSTEATGKQSIRYVCNLCQASHKLLFSRQRPINPPRPYLVELHVPRPRRKSRAAL